MAHMMNKRYLCKLSPRKIPSRLCHKDLRRVAIEGFYCHHGHMNTVLNLFGNLRNGLGGIGELLGYLLRFVSVFFQSRTSLAAIDPTKLISTSILGGLHHRYQRVAA